MQPVAGRGQRQPRTPRAPRTPRRSQEARGRRQRRRRGSVWPTILILLISGTAIVLGIMFFFQTRPPPPPNEETFMNAYGLAGYRKDAVTWRPHLAHGFSLQLPNGWELEKDDNSSRATITTAPDLATFLEEHYVFSVHIATTGVQIQNFNVGHTYNLNTDLMQNFLFRSLETQHFRNCVEQDPTVLYSFDPTFPAMDLMRHYICNNGYQVVDTVAVDNAPADRAMRIRHVGTTAEMKYLLHIPDTVRRLSE